MAFSQKTLDFLETNFSNNSREWYKEHKNEYREHVAEPFAAFISGLIPALHKIDDGIPVDPRRISRLFRDMRFVAGGPVFRENVWCTFAREQNVYTEFPCFYFELSPNGFEYGFGFYYAPAKTMEKMRGMILEGNKFYLDARDAYEKQQVFTMGGEKYKKVRYPDAPAADADWLNRRSIYFYAREEVSDAMFRDDLADRISAGYLAMEPIYRFLTRVVES